jgi:hypothetical protein
MRHVKLDPVALIRADRDPAALCPEVDSGK